MNPKEFEVFDQLADEVDEFVQNLLASEEFKPLLDKFNAACKHTGMSAGLSVEMYISEDGRNDSLRMLTTGIQCSANHDAYVASGDSSIHRYICDGEICQVPHDHCPNCWSDWDFKFKHRECLGCGYRLGHEVKLLLDSNQCPSCDVGTVTVSSPVCGKCGEQVDKSMVAWG